MWPWPTSNRGERVPRAATVAVDSDRQRTSVFARGMDAQASRETPLSATPGRSDDAWRREHGVRDPGARALT